MAKPKRYFGVEMTWSRPGLRINESGFSYRHDITYKIHQEARSRLEASDCQGIVVVEMDPGCLEYKTRMLSSYTQLRDSYTTARKISKSLGLVSHPDKATSGGGQVTVGVPTIRELRRQQHLTSQGIHIRRLVRLLSENPYISWIFGDPVDNHTHVMFGLNHLDKRFIRGLDDTMIKERRPGTKTMRFFIECRKNEFSQHVDSQVCGDWTSFVGRDFWGPIWNRDRTRSYALKLRTYFDDMYSPLKGTRLRDHFSVEMRFFGNPTCLAEQILHVEFAQALMEMAKTYEPQVDYIRRNFVAYSMDIKKCKRAFNSLLKKMNLNPTKYERFLPNLEERFSLGQDYLN